MSEVATFVAFDTDVFISSNPGKTGAQYFDMITKELDFYVMIGNQMTRVHAFDRTSGKALKLTSNTIEIAGKNLFQGKIPDNVGLDAV